LVLVGWQKGAVRHGSGVSALTLCILQHAFALIACFSMAEKDDGAQMPSDDVELGPPLEVERTQTSVYVPYTIYSKKQKIAIILAASVASFFSPMSANIYIPALNSVAADLHVSNTLINLTLTTYLVSRRSGNYIGLLTPVPQIFQGLAPAFVGGFSDSAGRRPAYLICIVIYLCANVGLATQDSFAALLVLRCLQSSGSSGTVALANAVAADVVTSGERGEYIGYTSVGAILAPSLAPVLGGVLAQFAGWRWIFWFLVIFAAAFFTPFMLFFPETCREIVGDGSIPPPPLNQSLLSFLRERRLKKSGEDTSAFFAERDRRAALRELHFPNPLSTLQIIFSKLAGLALLGNGVLFCCYYAVTSSLPSVFHANYGLNDLHISLVFLPFGIGGLLSALTTGRIIDANFRRHARRLGLPVGKDSSGRSRQVDLTHFPIERARLEVAVPAMLLGAGGLLAYGWMVARAVHIAAPCAVLLLVGYSITAGFNCMAILLVDLYPGKPATATAANNLVRCWMGAGAAAAVVPLVDAIGFGWTSTVAAGVWVGFMPVLAGLMWWGPGWRREAREKREAEERAAVGEAESDGKTVKAEDDRASGDKCAGDGKADLSRIKR
jgi:multidrug resistance protein